MFSNGEVSLESLMLMAGMKGDGLNGIIIYMFSIVLKMLVKFVRKTRFYSDLKSYIQNLPLFSRREGEFVIVRSFDAVFRITDGLPDGQSMQFITRSILNCMCEKAKQDQEGDVASTDYTITQLTYNCCVPVCDKDKDGKGIRLGHSVFARALVEENAVSTNISVINVKVNLQVPSSLSMSEAHKLVDEVLEDIRTMQRERDSDVLDGTGPRMLKQVLGDTIEVNCDRNGNPTSRVCPLEDPEDITMFSILGPLETSKTPENVFFEGKDQMMKYIAAFLSNKELCKNVGMEWACTMLLYGPPGSGKSSAIKMIANWTNRSLVIINPNQVLTKSTLESILSGHINGGKINLEKIIIVFEDIDRTAWKELMFKPGTQQNPDSACGLSSMTQSDWLNAFCGQEEHPGLMVIGTMNSSPENLDQAVCRTGRFKPFYVGYMSKSDIESMYQLWFNKPFPEDLRNMLKNGVFTLSDLGYLFQASGIHGNYKSNESNPTEDLRRLAEQLVDICNEKHATTMNSSPLSSIDSNDGKTMSIGSEFNNNNADSAESLYCHELRHRKRRKGRGRGRGRGKGQGKKLDT